MAKISTDTNEKVFQIKKFLGVNECPDGDTNLKYGEAAVMQNFKITDDGSLQLRPGSKNVAGLLSAYTISVAAETTDVVTELNHPASTFAAYPTIGVSAGGILTLSGTSVTVNYTNISTYSGYYVSINSLIYQLGTYTLERPSTGTLVTGGSVAYAATDTAMSHTFILAPTLPISYTSYTGLGVLNGALALSGEITESIYPDEAQNYVGRYLIDMGQIYWITEVYVSGLEKAYMKGRLITYVGDDTYTWAFYPVTATTESTDIAVRGIWSGYVNGVEYLVAAANSTLWSLTVDTDGIWTKTSIAAIDTTNGRVHMFGFDKKLYILDGTQYWVWDGTALTLVTGYRPLVSVSNVPAGGGTSLEQVNKLNGLRRAWFSPDGTATTFQLPETAITSVDYVKHTASGTAITHTANLTTGVITVSGAALTAGTNSIEIGWTYPTNYRSQVTDMRYSETYNGETDTRIFLYGDGSNKTFYSGLDYDGTPRADYFPDLNEIAVDSANTPITGMIKHFDRLLTFKPNGAFITTYGTITLSDGSTTAAFYTSPLNREMGNEALGQIRLVKNNPFTLFGKSVYEWQLSSYASKDERNAKERSQRVSTTLAGLDFSDAVCFDDIFNTEYYILQNGMAVVYNYTADAWYVYDGLDATCLISYKQETYFGTSDGYIRHLSRDYLNDNGENIVAFWESGSMSFNANYLRKYSPCLWVGIKPEAYGAIKVTVQTDRQTDYSTEDVLADNTDTVASGFFSFFDLDFTRLSFNVNNKPQMFKLKTKVKKFTYYKLIFSSNSVNTTATVTGADIRVRYTGDVR